MRMWLGKGGLLLGIHPVAWKKLNYLMHWFMDWCSSLLNCDSRNGSYYLAIDI